MVFVFGLGQSQSCLLFQVICVRLLAFVFLLRGNVNYFSGGFSYWSLFGRTPRRPPSMWWPIIVPSNRITDGKNKMKQWTSPSSILRHTHVHNHIVDHVFDHYIYIYANAICIYITLHCIALRYITFCIALHRIASHCNTVHDMRWQDMTLHYATLHYTTWYEMIGHDITLHYIALHYMIWDDRTWHYITLHCITLHDMRWQDMTLHCATLHYTTWHEMTGHDTTAHDITPHYMLYITSHQFTSHQVLRGWHGSPGLALEIWNCEI